MFKSRDKFSYIHNKTKKQFFLKKFRGHTSFWWGHWYPCFGMLVTSALGFKARVDITCTLSCLCTSPQIHLWWQAWWSVAFPTCAFQQRHRAQMLYPFGNMKFMMHQAECLLPQYWLQIWSNFNWFYGRCTMGFCNFFQYFLWKMVFEPATFCVRDRDDTIVLGRPR